MPRVNIVQKARKAIPSAGVEVGDKYYWWKFRYGGKRVSKTYPTRSQLTNSGFLQSLYELEDNLEFSREDLEGSVIDIVSQIESLRDECQDSLDNMPEHLQDSSESGQLLQERIESLDQWISDLEGVDLDVDEELTEEEKESRLDDIVSELEACSSGL